MIALPRANLLKRFSVCDDILRFCSLLEREEIDEGDVWFQQDSATTHMARISMPLLSEQFPECLNSLMGDLVWCIPIVCKLSMS